MTALADKIQQALDQEGRWQVSDVVQAIEAKRAFPFFHKSSVIVAEPRPYRKDLEVNCWVIAGHLDECFEVLPSVEDWARRIGAKYLCGGGRRGFERILSRRPGWKVRSTVMCKELV